MCQLFVINTVLVAFTSADHISPNGAPPLIPCVAPVSPANHPHHPLVWPTVMQALARQYQTMTRSINDSMHSLVPLNCHCDYGLPHPTHTCMCASALLCTLALILPTCTDTQAWSLMHATPPLALTTVTWWQQWHNDPAIVVTTLPWLLPSPCPLLHILTLGTVMQWWRWHDDHAIMIIMLLLWPPYPGSCPLPALPHAQNSNMMMMTTWWPSVTIIMPSSWPPHPGSCPLPALSCTPSHLEQWCSDNNDTMIVLLWSSCCHHDHLTLALFLSLPSPAHPHAQNSDMVVMTTWQPCHHDRHTVIMTTSHWILPSSCPLSHLEQRHGDDDDMMIMPLQLSHHHCDHLLMGLSLALTPPLPACPYACLVHASSSFHSWPTCPCMCNSDMVTMTTW